VPDTLPRTCRALRPRRSLRASRARAALTLRRRRGRPLPGFVDLLVLPHRKYDRRQTARHGDEREIRLQAALEQELVLVVKRVTGHHRRDLVRRALEDLL